MWVLSEPVMLINPFFMHVGTRGPTQLIWSYTGWEDFSRFISEMQRGNFFLSHLAFHTLWTHFLSTLFNAIITFRREMSQSLAMPKNSSMTNCFPPSRGQKNAASVRRGLLGSDGEYGSMLKLSLTPDHLRIPFFLCSPHRLCQNAGGCLSVHISFRIVTIFYFIFK